MMHEYDVNIRVPAADQESDIILISGVPSHVEKAKAGMAEKLIMLEADKEDRMKRSFEVTGGHKQLLPITFDRDTIETRKWHQCVSVIKSHRLICNMTHRYLLRSPCDLDLRSIL